MTTGDNIDNTQLNQMRWMRVLDLGWDLLGLEVTENALGNRLRQLAAMVDAP